MITPAEIQKKEFTKGVRGYKEEEVDSFLDLITLDMDKLMQENTVLRDTIRSLNQDMERYKGSEGALFATLESAKALMRDISSSAEKRAEIVLKNAELDAGRITREARESVERITEESALMSKRVEQFRTRYKNMLEGELERFDALSSDLLMQGDKDRIGFYTDYVTSPKPAVASGGTTGRDTKQGSQVAKNTSRTIKTPKRNV
jgi:cell division initiation protein